MPTTYAHWRFGKDCIDTLPEDLQIIISKNRKFFDIGVHGPDIFFYDLKHHDVSSFGSKVHRESGRSFFEHGIEVYRSHDDDKEAMLAYLLGFLSHFVLDSRCHAYINTKDAKTAASHNKIEAEYDGYLMRKEGFDVNDVDRSEPLRPDAFTSRVIARFFPFNEEQIMATTKGQRMIIGLLYCSNDLKRKLLTWLFRKMKRQDYMDLLVARKELELCRDSNLRLDKLKDEALSLYPVLADELMKKIRGEGELKEGFDLLFDPPADDSIPILSYEEELHYRI